MAITLNRAPRFIIAPNTQGDIRVPYSYSPAVVDPDGGALQFTLRQAPIGMTIDASGKLDWQPQQTGSYRVNLEVSDGFGHASNEAFSIEVRDGNTAPVITSQFPARVPAGVSLSFQILASDTDGDPLTYSIGSQAVGTSITAAGRVTWNNQALGVRLYPEERVGEFYVALDRRGRVLGLATFIDPRSRPKIVDDAILSLEVGVGVDLNGRIDRLRVYDYRGNASLAQDEFLRQLRGRTLASSFTMDADGLVPIPGEPDESQLIATAAYEGLLFMQVALGRRE